MPPWNLTDTEWSQLEQLLSFPQPTNKGGRPPVNKRQAAQACLYRHHHSHSTKYRCFKWEDLPDDFGISPTAANRWFNVWMRAAQWPAFYTALMRMRGGELQKPRPTTKPRIDRDLPVSEAIAELERAYEFFNDYFFAGVLDISIAISLELRSGWAGIGGYFCGRHWRNEDVEISHIAVSAAVLGKDALPAMEVLLHEMVHLRNYLVDVPDCHQVNQYHNRHFRDAAALAGLECPDRDPQRGYAQTRLGQRAKEAIALLAPDHNVFRWSLAPPKEQLPPLE